MGDLANGGPRRPDPCNPRIAPGSKHDIKTAFGYFLGADIQPCIGRVIHVDHRQRYLNAGRCSEGFGKKDRLPGTSRARAGPHRPALFEIREQKRLPVTDPNPVIAKFPQDLAVQSKCEKRAQPTLLNGKSPGSHRGFTKIQFCAVGLGRQAQLCSDRFQICDLFGQGIQAFGWGRSVGRLGRF